MGSSEVDSLNFQLFFGISGMVLLVAFIIIFFLIYQRRLLLEQERANQIEADYQKSLLTAGILAQEEDRKRMAIELHDSVGGLLSATKIYLQKIDPGLQAEQLVYFREKALRTVQENIQDVRNITNNLLPQSLERVGLVAATKGLCSKLKDLTHCDIKFISNEPTSFEKNREKAVFRILQELTNNTLKHAQATELSIEMTFAEKELLVAYQENGKGFAPQLNSVAETNSLGMKSIESRVNYLNAKMDFQSSPGKGVKVDLKVPITPLALKSDDHG